MLSFEWIKGSTLHEVVAPQWNQLVDLSPTGSVFHRWEWLAEWWKMRPPQDSLAILTVRDGAKLVGIAPMYVPGREFWRYLHMMGEVHSDYCNYLFDPAYEEAVWKVFAVELKVFCKANNLHGLIANDLPTAHLDQHFRQHGLAPRCLSTVVTPYCPLPSTWEAFVATLGKKNRQEIPRYFRRLEKQYTVTYGSAHEDATRREVALTSLFDLHTSYWQKRGLPGALTDDVRDFHRRVAASSKGLRLYEIRINGAARAIFYGYFYKQKMWAYLTGVDPDLTQDHLGTLIFGYAIRKTIEEGGYEFDLTRGEELYKTQTWNASCDRANSTIVIPCSMRSRLAMKLSHDNKVPGLGLRDFARMLRSRLRTSSEAS